MCTCSARARAFPSRQAAVTRRPTRPRRSCLRCHALLGIERCVIVHTAAHGYDLAATADALAAKGGAYLGVALMPTTISDIELKRADAQGFRGARFHYMQHLGKGHADRRGDRLRQAARRYRLAFADPHGGRADRRIGAGAASIAGAGGDRSYGPHRRFARARSGAVSQSAGAHGRQERLGESERRRPRHASSPSLGPPYADAVPFARKLVEEFGDRCVWGTDLPHPNHQGPIPDDGALVDLIGEIAPTQAARQALLVDNPQRFYRFAQARPGKGELIMSGRLQDRIAIVTGAGSVGPGWGNGRATCRALRRGRRQDFRGRPQSRHRPPRRWSR